MSNVCQHCGKDNETPVSKDENLPHNDLNSDSSADTNNNKDKKWLCFKWFGDNNPKSVDKTEESIEEEPQVQTSPPRYVRRPTIQFVDGESSISDRTGRKSVKAAIIKHFQVKYIYTCSACKGIFKWHISCLLIYRNPKFLSILD